MTAQTHTEVRCDCCDLPVYSCGLSADQRRRAEENAQRQRVLTTRGVVESRHPGRCSECGATFEPGEPIQRDPDGGGWRASCCIPDTATEG